MDKSWMFLPRQTEEYRKGLEGFLDFAFRNANINKTIACPCARCKIGICVSREDAYDHLMVDGFIKGYTHWVAHGELVCSASSISSSAPSQNDADDMEGLVHDAFGVPQHDDNIINMPGIEKDKEIPTGEAEKFYKLIDGSQKELYPGCKKFSKLSFIIRLLHLKCLGKITNKIFNMLPDLLREAFPNAMDDLPKSYYEAEKLMKQLGLGYEKIDACPNEPYILAYQAMQVFYVEDPVDSNWYVIITTDARAKYKMQPIVDVDTYLQSCICNPQDDNEHEEVVWVRDDAAGVEIDVDM